MRATAHTIASILAFLLGCICFSSLSIAADTPSTMLLVDGSGSMWARFEPDRRAKIDIVREKLTAIVQDAGDATPIGLTSFGHRRRADCTDVEAIAAPDTDKTALLDTLVKLNPHGKGPLADGLRAASQALGQSRPASIVLIHDGPDNCQQDACAAANDIAKTMPGVPVHVVGIAIPKNTVPQSACIAEATGGTFINAENSEALLTALDDIAKLAKLTPADASEQALSAATIQQPPNESTLHATAALAAGAPALAEPLKWKIFKSGETTALKETEGKNFKGRIDPGSYEIVASLEGITARQTISIEAGQQADVVVPFDMARVKVRASATKGGAPSAAAIVTVASTSKPDQSWIGNAGFLQVMLPPDQYAISVADGTTRKAQTVDLAAGTDATVDIELASGTLQLSATSDEKGSELDDVLYIVAEDDPYSSDGRREVARSHAATPRFTLPSGTYYVTARSGDSETQERIALGAGDAIERSLLVPIARLKVTAAIAGQPAAAADGIVYRVTELEGSRAEIVRSISPELDLKLTPGKYRVTANVTAHQLTAEKDIVLEAGKPAAVTIAIDAGEVHLHNGSNAAAADLHWEILDADGQPVWQTTGREAKALLAPGRYTARLESRNGTMHAAFEVKSGESQSIDVSQN